MGYHEVAVETPKPRARVAAVAEGEGVKEEKQSKNYKFR